MTPHFPDLTIYVLSDRDHKTIHEIRYRLQSGLLSLECDCQGFMFESICRHILMVLRNDDDEVEEFILTNTDDKDWEVVTEAMSRTKIPGEYAAFATTKKQLELQQKKIKVDLKENKKKLRRALDGSTLQPIKAEESPVA